MIRLLQYAWYALFNYVYKDRNLISYIVGTIGLVFYLKKNQNSASYNRRYFQHAYSMLLFSSH